MVCPWNHDSCAKTYQLGLGLNPGTWVFTGKTCWYLWMFILTFRCKIRTLYQLYWKSYSYIYSHIWRLPSTQLETFIYCDSSPQVLFPSSAILVPQSLMGESWRIKPYVYYCAVPDEKKTRSQWLFSFLHPWDPIPRKFTRQRRCPSLVLIIEIPADGDVFFLEDIWVQVQSGLKQLRHTWNHPNQAGPNKS